MFLIFLKINKNANETKTNDTENNCCLDELVKNIKTGDSSTSSLWQHLKFHHKEKYLELIDVQTKNEIKQSQNNNYIFKFIKNKNYF